jgi:hypothetical protein
LPGPEGSLGGGEASPGGLEGIVPGPKGLHGAGKASPRGLEGIAGAGKASPRAGKVPRGGKRLRQGAEKLPGGSRASPGSGKIAGNGQSLACSGSVRTGECGGLAAGGGFRAVGCGMKVTDIIISKYAVESKGDAP